MYRVENTAGGTIYAGNSLSAAIRATEDLFALPYVVSAKGSRPVHDGQVGEYGQNYVDFVVETDE
jgi:hypothetical protein